MFLNQHQGARFGELNRKVCDIDGEIEIKPGRTLIRTFVSDEFTTCSKKGESQGDQVGEGSDGASSYQVVAV